MAQPDADGNRPDAVINEIGGTVAISESQPFLRQRGKSGTISAGRTWLFCTCRWRPTWRRRVSSKPTQHSVAALRIGITPDALILRCDRDVPEALENKIALM